jgi:hypothetical protein
MSDVVLTIGEFTLTARFETDTAPRTCAAFRRLLPLDSHVLHVRWSGQAVWVPLGDLQTGIPPENATSYPTPGEILFYPGGISEAEILIAYSGTRFASRAGQLAGNHFLTLTSGIEHLTEIGRLALWQGAQKLSIQATQ